MGFDRRGRMCALLWTSRSITRMEVALHPKSKLPDSLAGDPFRSPTAENAPPPADKRSLTPLDRARSKAYSRLLPILFLCYVVAYVDRNNVSIAKLTMSKDMPAFNDKVIGFGSGIFFIGYFLLEIPGTLLVEKWSARKWICRIMVTWGV